MEKCNISKFITSGLKRGLTIEEIKQQLLSRGFFDYDINEAISQLNLKEYSEKKEKPSPKKAETIEGWDKEIPQS
jgi:hypothetical protein